MSKNLCTKCCKRNSCISLCPKAMKYANQGYKSQRESLYPPVRNREDANFNLALDNISYHLVDKPEAPNLNIKDYLAILNEPVLSFPFLTSLQNRCLQLFYFEGLSYAEIARNLKKDKKKVDNCIYSAKRKILGFHSKNEGGVRKNVIKS